MAKNIEYERLEGEIRKKLTGQGYEI